MVAYQLGLGTDIASCCTMGRVSYVGSYIHVNNICCTAIIVMKWKTKCLKNWKKQREKEREIYWDKLVKEGGNQYLEKMSLINDLDPYKVPN